MKVFLLLHFLTRMDAQSSKFYLELFITLPFIRAVLQTAVLQSLRFYDMYKLTLHGMLTRVYIPVQDADIQRDIMTYRLKWPRGPLVQHQAICIRDPPLLLSCFLHL